MTRRRSTAWTLLLCAPLTWGAPSALVTTAPVTRASLADTIEAEGEVRSDGRGSIEVDAAISGEITSVAVRERQRVRAGQELLRLRVDPQQARGYAQAERDAAAAQAERDRQAVLLGEHLATRSQLAAATNAAADARDALAALRHLGLPGPVVVVTAAADGEILRIDGSPGRKVNAGVTLVQMAPGASRMLVLGVEPDEAMRLQSGTPVRIAPTFDPGLAVDLLVGSVDSALDPVSHLVDVQVPLPGATGAASFLTGVRVTGKFRLEPRTLLSVPHEALLDEGGDHVFVVRNGKAVRVAVQRLVEEGARVGVGGTLDAGDEVVLDGNQVLTDGMAVRVGPH